MSRTFQDRSLLRWEAYASGGRYGYADHAKIVFHCVSDRSRRARVVERECDQSEAERQVTSLSDAELTELLEAATELS